MVLEALPNMEATKLIAIDMDTSTNSSRLTASTFNQLEQINKYDIKVCLNGSKEFQDSLSVFDETVKHDRLLLAVMCDKLGITEQHNIKIYEIKSMKNENFLKNLFTDCSKEIRNFNSAIEFLSEFPKANFLVKSLTKEKTQKKILDEIEQSIRATNGYSVKVTITNKNGETIDWIKSTSSSSLGTNSSNDSDKYPKLYVLFVYHTEQNKKNSMRLARFREQIERSNIVLIDFDLTRANLNVEAELQRFEQIPIFLVYDKLIDDLIDCTKRNNNEEYKNIFKFYYELYAEYLKNGFNKRFYVFTLDDYACYCEKGPFKYHWLLKKMMKSNGDEQLMRPPQVPTYDIETVDLDLQKFLKYFERIARPF